MEVATALFYGKKIVVGDCCDSLGNPAFSRRGERHGAPCLTSFRHVTSGDFKNGYKIVPVGEYVASNTLPDTGRRDADREVSMCDRQTHDPLKRGEITHIVFRDGESPCVYNGGSSDLLVARGTTNDVYVFFE
jgi:hypothetical protein